MPHIIFISAAKKQPASQIIRQENKFFSSLPHNYFTHNTAMTSKCERVEWDVNVKMFYNVLCMKLPKTCEVVVEKIARFLTRITIFFRVFPCGAVVVGKKPVFGSLSLNWHPNVILFSQSHVYTPQIFHFLLSSFVNSNLSLEFLWNSHANTKLSTLFRTLSGNSRRLPSKFCGY